MDVKYSWKRLDPAADPKHGKPCTRSSHGVTWIPPSGAVAASRLIVYGGETIARTPLDESQSTWACDFDASDSCQWRLISTASSSSASPPLRVAHAQAFHEKTSCLYVFGGRAGITMQEQAMNDLWKLDCSGPAGAESWSQVTPKGGNPPEARSFHKMVCIGDSLFVFGGCGAEHGRLADMHRFDIDTQTWHNLGGSQHLRGRGGANLVPLDGGSLLGVVAGFAGEETNDGHLFDVKQGKWCPDSLTADLEGLRPRSVCVSGSFPSAGVSIIFGGEVDPSAKGHEGAGSFDNSIVVLEEKSGKFVTTLSPTPTPEGRGWSDGDAVDNGDGSGKLYLFGGLTGDDTNPRRLDDLWILNVEKAK